MTQIHLSTFEPTTGFTSKQLCLRNASEETYRAAGDVLLERERQDDKWGEQNHDAGKWLLILQEEIGEWSMAVLDKDPKERIREELVQVAAVALSMLECHDRVNK